MEQLSTKSKQTMGSREIAELTSKNHADVMRDIRNVESAYIQVFGAERKFALGYYYDVQNQKRPEYQLNKSQTLYLVSGYDPILRAKIQKRWEELEEDEQNEDLVILRSIYLRENNLLIF